MSIDPEELLEEALRNDMPSKDAEARLRRKLLGAGVAVGNGIATTTAAASGGAVTGAGGAGLVAKVAGLSWGVKVGLAAAVASPSVGLWLERTEPAPAPARSAPALLQVAPPTSGAATPEPARAPAPRAEALAAPEARASELAPTRAAVRADKPALEPADVALAARPSQGDFAPPEPALVAPPPAGSTLGDETRLLDRAFAELAAGHRVRAAELLAEHESRYPEGLLVKERERAKAKISELSRGE
jgi:hypothetical protein